MDAMNADFATNDEALTSSITLLRQALAHEPGDRPSILDLSASFDNAAYLLGPRRIKALEPTIGRQIPQPIVPSQTLLPPTIARPTQRQPEMAPPIYDPTGQTIARNGNQAHGLSIRSKSRSGILVAAAVAMIALGAAAAVALTRDSGEATQISEANEVTPSVTTVISQVVATVAPATTVPPVTTTTISDPLQSHIAQDRPMADTLVDFWVAQLSAKKVGLETGGITYDLNTIRSDHELLRSRYDAILVDGGAFQFTTGGEPMIGWYLTIVPVGYGSKSDAVEWCKAHGLKTPEEVTPGPVLCYGRKFQPPNP